jgi:hypothetical protein
VIEIVVDLLRDSPTATQFCESLLAPTTTITSTSCVNPKKDYRERTNAC